MMKEHIKKKNIHECQHWNTIRSAPLNNKNPLVCDGCGIQINLVMPGSNNLSNQSQSNDKPTINQENYIKIKQELIEPKKEFTMIEGHSVFDKTQSSFVRKIDVKNEDNLSSSYILENKYYNINQKYDQKNTILELVTDKSVLLNNFSRHDECIKKLNINKTLQIKHKSLPKPSLSLYIQKNFKSTGRSILVNTKQPPMIDTMIQMIFRNSTSIIKGINWDKFNSILLHPMMLKVHFQIINEKKLPYECYICNRKLHTTSVAYGHLKKHSKNLKCCLVSQCNKKFNLKKQFKYNILHFHKIMLYSTLPIQELWSTHNNNSKNCRVSQQSIEKKMVKTSNISANKSVIFCYPSKPQTWTQNVIDNKSIISHSLNEGLTQITNSSLDVINHDSTIIPNVLNKAQTQVSNIGIHNVNKYLMSCSLNEVQKPNQNIHVATNKSISSHHSSNTQMLKMPTILSAIKSDKNISPARVLRSSKRTLSFNKLEDLIFQCDKCDKSFYRRRQLAQHSCKICEHQMFCNECNIVLKTITCIRSHVNSHVGTNTYTCIICNKIYMWKNEINDYIWVSKSNFKTTSALIPVVHQQPQEQQTKPQPQECTEDDDIPIIQYNDQSAVSNLVKHHQTLEEQIKPEYEECMEDDNIPSTQHSDKNGMFSLVEDRQTLEEQTKSQHKGCTEDNNIPNTDHSDKNAMRGLSTEVLVLDKFSKHDKSDEFVIKQPLPFHLKEPEIILSSTNMVINHKDIHCEKLGNTDFCEKTQPSHQSELNHMKKHLNSNNHPYKHCKKSFYKVRKKAGDMPKEHDLMEKYQCENCHRWYKYLDNLNLHKARVHQIHSTPYSTSVPTLSALQSDKDVSPARILRSSKTTFSFNELDDLKFQCNKCDKSFYRRRGLAQHSCKICEHQMFCNECNIVLKTITSVKSHVNLHVGTNTYTCIICNKIYRWENEINDYIWVSKSNLKTTSALIPVVHQQPQEQQTKPQPQECTENDDIPIIQYNDQSAISNLVKHHQTLEEQIKPEYEECMEDDNIPSTQHSDKNGMFSLVEDRQTLEEQTKSQHKGCTEDNNIPNTDHSDKNAVRGLSTEVLVLDKFSKHDKSDEFVIKQPLPFHLKEPEIILSSTNMVINYKNIHCEKLENTDFCEKTQPSHQSELNLMKKHLNSNNHPYKHCKKSFYNVRKKAGDMPKEHDLMEKYQCENCHRWYKYLDNLNLHKARVHQIHSTPCSMSVPTLSAPQSDKDVSPVRVLRSSKRTLSFNKLEDLIFQCDKCDKSFYRRRQLAQHSCKICEHQMFCNECNIVLKTITSVRSHVNSHVGTNTYTCIICNRIYRWENEINDYIWVSKSNLNTTSALIPVVHQQPQEQQTKPQPQECTENDDIPIIQYNDQSAISNLVKHHQTLEEQIKSEYEECMEDDDIPSTQHSDKNGMFSLVEDRQTLEEQTKSQHKGCTEDNNIPNTDHSDKNAMRGLSTEVLVLDEFSKHDKSDEFVIKQPLPFHLKEPEIILSSTNMVINHEDIHCKKLGNTDQLLNDIHHNQYAQETFSNKDKLLNNNAKCSICSKLFLNLRMLKIHVQIVHHNILPYMCDLCGKTYQNIRTALDHAKMHVKLGCFPCNYCSKQFYKTSNLMSHMYREHKTVKFKCDQCDGLYVSPLTLSAHKYRKHKAVSKTSLVHIDKTHVAADECTTSYSKNDVLVASKCDETYEKSTSAKESLLNQHDNGILIPLSSLQVKDEPKDCINDKVATKTGIMILDNEDLPKNHSVMCNHCNILFVNSKLMGIHIWEVHNRLMPFQCDLCGKKQFSLIESFQHSNLHAMADRHPCDHCEKEFYKKSHLLTHVSKYHNQFKKFQDDQCDMNYKTPKSLESHEGYMHAEEALIS